MSLYSPRGKLLPRLVHQFAICGKVGQPQPVNARSFRVKQPRVEICLLSGRASVHDHAAEIPQATHALGDVLPAQHFEDGINAFPVRQRLDGFFIISLLVVDAVLQAEFLHTCQLLIRGRRSVHFHPEQLSNLRGRGSHAAGDSVNQNSWCASPRPCCSRQSRFPICEKRGEVVDRESGALLRAPTARCRPQEFGSRSGTFGECGPLGVSHDLLAVALPHSAEFPAGN